MLLTVITPTANVLGNPQEPDRLSSDDTQLLFGEQFFVEESHGAYVQGHCVHDNYRGYIEREQLIKNAPKPTHFIKVRASHLYTQPDFKSRPNIVLSFMSQISVSDKIENGFMQLKDGLWIFCDHIAPIIGYKMPEDFASTAMIFLGTPYLFGGRSVFGVDCSGLVQQVLKAHGYAVPPRDAKDQMGAFGEKVDDKQLQRNDIVFFKGHVGIMLDDNKIFNATARHMSTVIEEINDLKKAYDGIKHVARL